MKLSNFFKSAASVAVLGAALLSSCTEDSTTDDAPDSPIVDGVLPKQITSDLRVPFVEGQTYYISGGTYVKSGVTLTIDAGVTIKNDPAEPAVAYLVVEQGAKIMAEGTAAKPIVFTSSKATPAPGDWGGIIIAGNAKINVPGGSAATEVDGEVMYGGDNNADNSGVLKYIRVEYTGNAINDSKQHNGFSFYGVGNGTVVSHLQAYNGNDDGFEWFGGSVVCNNLLSTGSLDDSFDWTQGYVGGGENWWAVQRADAGDRGIEADNNGDNNSLAPFSNPTISGITLQGNGRLDGEKVIDGIKLREGTKAALSNVVVKNFSGVAVNVQHDVTLTNTLADEVTIDKLTAESNGTNEVTYKGDDADLVQQCVDAAKIKVTGDATGADETVFAGWTIQ